MAGNLVSHIPYHGEPDESAPAPVRVLPGARLDEQDLLQREIADMNWLLRERA